MRRPLRTCMKTMWHSRPRLCGRPRIPVQDRDAFGGGHARGRACHMVRTVFIHVLSRNGAGAAAFLRC